MDPDQLIKRIESIQITFEFEPDGYAVDRETGQGTPPERKVDLDRMMISIQFVGEFGQVGVTEPYATNIYEEIWKFLNETKAKEE